VPVLVVTGQWLNPFADPGQPELALLAMGIIHALVYATFVWLVGIAGPVFAGQTAYLVTACGMVWAMVLLDERFAPTVWAAMATMLAGVALVRPRTGRGNETLVPQVQKGENSAR
jgi:drug/metabolite transporter (DMT)-like permease